MAREKFEQACSLCGEPIPLEWDNGVILPAGVVLVADWVYHDLCWDKLTKDMPTTETVNE